MPQLKTRPAAVFFDLDGTLVDTADDLAAKTGGTITHDAGIEGDTLITADGTPRTVKLKKNPAYTALTPSN